MDKMDKRIKEAFEMITPSERLEKNIDRLVRDHKCTTGKKRVKAPARFIAIAAAFTLIAAAGVTAYTGIRFYQPGIGIVDNSGRLVVAEGKMTTDVYVSESFELGGKRILGVTYSDGYAVRIDGSENIEDLTLTLSDGSRLSQTNTRFSFNKSTICVFDGEFSESVTLSSETLGDEKTIVLERSDAGYVSASHGGLTLTLRTLTNDMGSFEIDFSEDQTGDEIPVVKTIRDLTKKGKAVFYGSDGKKYTPAIYEGSSVPGGGFIQRITLDKPSDVMITSVEFNDLTFSCRPAKDSSLKVKIPEDGGYVIPNSTLYAWDGLSVSVEKIERQGNHLIFWFPEGYTIGSSGRISLGGDGTYGDRSICFGFRPPEKTNVTDNDPEGFTFGGSEKATMKDGRLCLDVEIKPLGKSSFDLGDYETITLTIERFEFAINGSWRLEF